MYHYGDDNSVQSGLSVDSYPQPYDMNVYPGMMHHPHYYHAMMYAHHHPSPIHPGVFDPSMHEAGYAPEAYGVEHYEDFSWNGQMQAIANPLEQAGTPSKASDGHSQECAVPVYPPNPHYIDPSTPATQMDGEHTPYKYNPASPYWGHLDHTTLALMGIATPQGMPSPQTPSRGMPLSPEELVTEGVEDSNIAPVNAQPLLLRQPYPTYGYYGTREGYGPPSPATQFMMSPQANFGYGYAAYGGFSPNRSASPSHPFAAVQHSAGAPVASEDASVPTSVTTPQKTKVEKQSDTGKAAAREE